MAKKKKSKSTDKATMEAKKSEARTLYAVQKLSWRKLADAVGVGSVNTLRSWYKNDKGTDHDWDDYRERNIKNPSGKDYKTIIHEADRVILEANKAKNELIDEQVLKVSAEKRVEVLNQYMKDKQTIIQKQKEYNNHMQWVIMSQWQPQTEVTVNKDGTETKKTLPPTPDFELLKSAKISSEALAILFKDEMKLTDDMLNILTPDDEKGEKEQTTWEATVKTLGQHRKDNHPNIDASDDLTKLMKGIQSQSSNNGEIINLDERRAK